MAYSRDVFSIDWKNLSTAYGTAENIPDLLISLLSKNEETAYKSASLLEGYLCHQHVQLHNGSAAALPFLLEALLKTSPQVSEELLFVLWGYALATEDKFWRQRPAWMCEVAELLFENIGLFEKFKQSDSEDSVFYSNQILSLLKTNFKQGL